MFKIIGFVLKFYPVVTVIIELVEAFAAGKPGEEKKAIVLKVIEQVAPKFGVVLTDSHLKILSQVIDAIVEVLNILGIFKKDNPEYDLIEEERVVITKTKQSEIDLALENLIQ